MNLDQYVPAYTSFNDEMTVRRYNLFASILERDFNLKGTETCLEYGPGTGVGTPILLNSFNKVLAVEGSSVFADRLREKYKDNSKLEVVESKFEDLLESGIRGVDVAFLSHVLEHVDSPSEILKITKQLLGIDGLLVASVPNANSIHRQTGVRLGLMPDLSDVGDTSTGHQRVYTAKSFVKEIESCGFLMYKTFGTLIKPCPDMVMERSFQPESFDVLFEVGRTYPEIAADIVVVAFP